ncbi:hypothetical protein NLG97_g1514 [Lecanicillium saksenae]|uniref:Uncharacterized protein n=1 Tax=Lecanicillium saksenae TaxID=468837 RepID=A0ACC1R3S4_9HYPO|nr:hypothetical protein NLG97_g1514 [Lecanicillium saksenae]
MSVEASTAEYARLLCAIAKQVGFSNPKIERGCSGRALPRLQTKKFKRPFLSRDWRAGTPPLAAYRFLECRSFIHQIYSGTINESNTPDPLFVQSDMLRSFFPYELNIPAGLATYNRAGVDSLETEQASEHEMLIDDMGSESEQPRLAAVGSMHVDTDVEMGENDRPREHRLQIITARRGGLSNRAAAAKEARRLGPLRRTKSKEATDPNGRTIRPLRQRRVAPAVSVTQPPISNTPTTQANEEALNEEALPAIPVIDSTVSPLEVQATATTTAAQPTVQQRPLHFAPWNNVTVPNSEAQAALKLRHIDKPWTAPTDSEIRDIASQLREGDGQLVPQNVTVLADNRTSVVAVPDALRQDVFMGTEFHESQPSYPDDQDMTESTTIVGDIFTEPISIPAAPGSRSHIGAQSKRKQPRGIRAQRHNAKSQSPVFRIRKKAPASTRRPEDASISAVVQDAAAAATQSGTSLNIDGGRVGGGMLKENQTIIDQTPQDSSGSGGGETDSALGDGQANTDETPQDPSVSREGESDVADTCSANDKRTPAEAAALKRRLDYHLQAQGNQKRVRRDNGSFFVKLTPQRAATGGNGTSYSDNSDNRPGRVDTANGQEAEVGQREAALPPANPQRPAARDSGTRVNSENRFGERSMVTRSEAEVDQHEAALPSIIGRDHPSPPDYDGIE